MSHSFSGFFQRVVDQVPHLTDCKSDTFLINFVFSINWKSNWFNEKSFHQLNIFFSFSKVNTRKRHITVCSQPESLAYFQLEFRFYKQIWLSKHSKKRIDGHLDLAIIHLAERVCLKSPILAMSHQWKSFFRPSNEACLLQTCNMIGRLGPQRIYNRKKSQRITLFQWKDNLYFERRTKSGPWSPKVVWLLRRV